MNRVADNTLARKLLGGCEPEVKFVEGLRRTIDWYFATHEHEAVAKGLERRLIERS
jgi:nucleoside-diphosphate-sugar epimerase